MQTKSYSAAEVQHGWFIVDAEDVVLGRLASRVAAILRGKNKPTFTPNADTGDFVVIVNAEKVKLTGNKEETKQYHRYTGYVGGVRTTTPRKLRETHPERIITHAVKGMLPKGPLGRKMFKKLKVYAGPEHPHKAQKPEALKF